MALALTSLTLAACGGGGDDNTAAAAPAAPVVPVVTAPVVASATVTVAPLVISASTPTGMDGTLDKTTGIPESTFGDSSGAYSSSSPNPYCRVAVYELTNSGDTKKYDIELTYAKADRSIGLVGMSLNGGAATFSARTNSGTGVTVDTVNRRIGFSNVVLGAGTTKTVTLNGSLEFTSFTGPAADVAACGG